MRPVSAEPGESPFRAHHDLGGVRRFLCTPVEREEHSLSDFDREVDALRQVLAQHGLLRVDELRRGIESIPEERYFALSYYERWAVALADVLLSKGVVRGEELRAALSEGSLE
jgi:hypothetical protein